MKNSTMFKGVLPLIALLGFSMNAQAQSTKTVKENITGTVFTVNVVDPDGISATNKEVIAVTVDATGLKYFTVTAANSGEVVDAAGSDVATGVKLNGSALDFTTLQAAAAADPNLLYTAATLTTPATVKISFTITATDDGQDNDASTSADNLAFAQQVELIVEEVNNLVKQLKASTFSLAENVGVANYSAGQSVAVLEAQDGTGIALTGVTYAVASGTNFTIGGTSSDELIYTSTSTLDFEAAATAGTTALAVVLNITDSAGVTDKFSVVVNVTNVNEAPTAISIK